MIRNLNYTGRMKIPRERLAITLVRHEDSGLSFKVRLDLNGLGLPGDADVYIEPYYRASAMRLRLGAVGQVGEAAEYPLTEIPTRDVVHFRVKVVASSGLHSRILAAVDGVTATSGQRHTLLPVNFIDLEDQVWRLNLEDKPVLELNNRIVNPSIEVVARSDGQFSALVYPAVLHLILSDIAREDYDTDTGGEYTWFTKWVRFAELLPGVSSYPAGAGDDTLDARAEWIEEAVRAFCRLHGLAGKFQRAKAQEER